MTSFHHSALPRKSKSAVPDISASPLLVAGATEPALHADEWRPFALFEKRHLTPDSLWLRFATPGRRPAVGSYAPRCALCTLLVSHVCTHVLQGLADCGQYLHVGGPAEADGNRVWRPYTPVSQQSDVGFIDLAVKVYEGGKMSKIFSDLTVGQSVFMRGPRTHYSYSRYVRTHAAAARCADFRS